MILMGMVTQAGETIGHSFETTNTATYSSNVTVIDA
jgi:hypothetical protein